MGMLHMSLPLIGPLHGVLLTGGKARFLKCKHNIMMQRGLLHGTICTLSKRSLCALLFGFPGAVMRTVQHTS